MRKQLTIWFILCMLCLGHKPADEAYTGKDQFIKEVTRVLKPIILRQADWAMMQQPETVTSFSSPRSAGGPHDFFSEGDYWWPNPVNADSPYIQKDGLTNPDNFTAHRKAMIRFSKIAGALTSAYRLTGDKKYVAQLIKHCRAWFTDTATLMHPSLLYAQAIKGRFTGRGIGIIDTIQLIEVAQSLYYLQQSGAISAMELVDIRKWFEAYLQWLTTHKYGKDEMNASNNHGTCWVMQVAVFARFTGNEAVMDLCRDRFRSVLLPQQMAPDGSFPKELQRTKPYGYSIFNLDAMSTICHVLSVPGNDLWKYSTPDGRNIQNAIDFLYPFLKDKQAWTFKQDVMYWNEWPVAQPCLLFGSYYFDNDEWLHTWKVLEHDPGADEVIRNLPVRNPLIWL